MSSTRYTAEKGGERALPASASYNFMSSSRSSNAAATSARRLKLWLSMFLRMLPETESISSDDHRVGSRRQAESIEHPDELELVSRDVRTRGRHEALQFSVTTSSFRRTTI